MPFPATRYPVPDVGASGDQGPGIAPCSHAQVGGLFRFRQSEYWQVRPFPMRQVRRPHVRSVPEEVAAASVTWQAHGDRAGQREIPPCPIARAPAEAIPQGSDLAVTAAIQSATGPHRAGLEAGAAFGDAQPLLRHPGRIAHRGRLLFRPMAETKRSAAEIMRHYLRRYV